MPVRAREDERERLIACVTGSAPCGRLFGEVTAGPTEFYALVPFEGVLIRRARKPSTFPS